MRTHVDLQPGRQAALQPEAAGGDGLHDAGDGQRRAGHRQLRHRQLRADRQRDGRADAGLDRLPHRIGIVDAEERHVVEILPDDLTQRIGGVHRAAAGAVVVVIQQHHRQLARRAFHRLGAAHRCFQRLDVEHERRAVPSRQH